MIIKLCERGGLYWDNKIIDFWSLKNFGVSDPTLPSNVKCKKLSAVRVVRRRVSHCAPFKTKQQYLKHKFAL